MRPMLVILILLILLAFTAALSWDAWVAVEGVEISGHGYTAMALGILFSLALGIGLMGLMFYSSRHGYDDPPDRPY